MNKKFYRTKYNAKLGTYVAVSELAKSHNGDTSTRVGVDKAEDLSQTPCLVESAYNNRTLKQLVVVISTMMALTPTYAQVVANAGAATAQKPTILKADNATNVWITTPSAKGVSRNSYSQFDVDKNGVILNNARGAAVSKITGNTIAANPYLATGAANTIVNEVVSTNPSLLQGNVEVLGSRANVIIANPSGITINGGGFINAYKTTLSTGTINYNDDGSIKQHVVRQGAITVNPDANGYGLGGSDNSPTTLELLGRSISINAPVNSTYFLTAIAGANAVDAETGEYYAVAATGTAPTVAIDVAQLGGLYANSIYLYANDRGIGINNAGVIKAKNNLVLDSNGRIINTSTGVIQSTDAADGTMFIKTNLNSPSGDIFNHGKIQSANSLFIDAGRHISLTQDSYTGVTNSVSTGLVSLSAKGNVVSRGAVIKQYANNRNLYIDAGEQVSLAGTQSNGNDNNIGSNGGVYINSGAQFGVRDALITGISDVGLNSKTNIDFGNSRLYSHVGGLYITSEGTAVDLSGLKITNVKLEAETDIVAQSAADLEIGNLILPGTDSTVEKSVSRVDNLVLDAKRNLNLNISDKVYSRTANDIVLQAGEKIYIDSDLPGSKGSELKATNDFNINAKTIEVGKATLSTGYKPLNLTAENNVILRDGAQLWSSNDINVSTLNQEIGITNSNIYASGKVNLNAKTLVHIYSPATTSSVSGTTLQEKTYAKGRIIGDAGVNINSLTHNVTIDPVTIKSSAGDVSINAKGLIYLFGKENTDVVQNADNTYTSKQVAIGTDIQGNNVNLHSEGEINIKNATVKALTGDLSIQSSVGANVNSALTLTNTTLFSESDTVLNAGGSGSDFTFLGGNATAKGNMVINSADLIYFNSYYGNKTDSNGVYLYNEDGTYQQGSNWRPTSTVNLAADGVLSITSNYYQHYKNTKINAGAIFTDSIKSGAAWVGTNAWNAKGGTNLDGILSIATGKYNIYMGPKILDLSATGDIYVDVNAGKLAIEDNGLDKAKIVSTGGGINLSATDTMTLEGSQLKANKDINIRSVNAQNITNNASLYSEAGGIYLATTGTDPNASKLSLDATLDAQTNIVAQSTGDLNVSNLRLPGVDSTVANSVSRVDNLVFNAEKNLNLNLSDKTYSRAANDIVLQAGEKVYIDSDLPGSKGSELKATNDFNINAKTIEVGKATLSTGFKPLSLTAENNVILQNGAQLWSSNDINVSALNQGIKITDPNIYASGRVNLNAKELMHLYSSYKDTAFSGTDYIDRQFVEGRIQGDKGGVNISSVNNRIVVDAININSTSGDVLLQAKNGIDFYAKANTTVSKDSQGNYVKSSKYIENDVKGTNVDIHSTNDYVAIDKRNVEAYTGDIDISANKSLTTIGSTLTAKENILLSSGDGGVLTLRGMSATAGKNIALSSKEQVYLNAYWGNKTDYNGNLLRDADGNLIPGVNWGSNSSSVNLTAGGVLSIYSDYYQHYKNTNFNAGAILVDSIKSGMGWVGNNTWTTKQSGLLTGAQYDFITKDANGNDVITKEKLNGALSIDAAKFDITIDPNILTLSAAGNIDIRAQAGNLTFKGYGGTAGNGSEEKVYLNNVEEKRISGALGSATMVRRTSLIDHIYLQGKNVTLQGASLTANDIDIVSTDGDIIIDGIKNNVTNKTVFTHQADLNRIKELNQIELDKIYADEDYKYLLSMDDKIVHTYLVGSTLDKLNPVKERLEKKYPISVNITHGYTYQDKRTFHINFDIDYVKENSEIDDTLAFLNGSVNGFEHKGSRLYSMTGDINIASKGGVSISGSDIIATNGGVSINAEKALTGVSYHPIAANPDGTSIGAMSASILIDGFTDFYDKGKETDANYSLRSFVKPTEIRAAKDIEIRTVGTTSNDNLVIQAADIQSTAGSIAIESGRDLFFDVAMQESYDKTTNKFVKRTWYGKKKVTITTTTDSLVENAPVGLTAAKNITLQSGNNAKIFSTGFEAGGDITIKSKGHLEFLTTKNVVDYNSTSKSRSSILGINYNKTTTNTTRNQVENIPSTLTASSINTKSGLNTVLAGTEFNYLKDATIEAGGTIEFIAVKDLYQKTHTVDSNSVVWQKMVDQGQITETAKLPSFNGPVLPKFVGSLTVQVPVANRTASQAELITEIEKLANQPGNAYLKSLVDNKNQQVNWQEILLTNEEWNYKSQGLTAAGAAILAIIIAAATAGAGSAILGTTSTVGTATTITVGGAQVSIAVGGSITTFGGTIIGYTTASGAATAFTAVGTMMNAGLTTLATQASISAANNGGDLGKVFKDLGSKDSVKGLVTSVLTAGLMDKLNKSLNVKLDNPLADKAVNNFVNGVSSSIVQSTIQGGNLSDNLEQALLAGLSSTVQGGLAQNIKPLEDVNYFLHKIAHAAAGCIAAAIVKECEAGAIGAVVGEVVAEQLDKSIADKKFESEKEILDYQKKVRDLSKLTAGVVAAYAGFDVDTAVLSADIAIQNNNQLSEAEIESIKYRAKNDPVKEARLSIAACALVHCSAGYPEGSTEYLYTKAMEDIGNSAAYKSERDELANAWVHSRTYKNSYPGFQYKGIDPIIDVISKWGRTYNVNVRLEGTLQFAGGVLGGVVSAGAAVTTCETGLGCILAYGGLVTSADQIVAGGAKMIQGKSINTIGAEYISKLTGLSMHQSELVYGTLNFATLTMTMRNSAQQAYNAGRIYISNPVKTPTRQQAFINEEMLKNNFYRDSSGTASLIRPATLERIYQDAAKVSTHNSSAKEVVLGNYIPASSKSYDVVARSRGSTYFSMSDWATVQGIIGGENMWGINRAFLDQQISQGKSFVFTIDPRSEAVGYYTKLEYTYLQQRGYTLLKEPSGGLYRVAKN